ncbi:MAG: TolC family protein [Deltaproteobacteria bacterium]|nr:TolC family protein [Deltaproteobacteria bacterium]
MKFFFKIFSQVACLSLLLLLCTTAVSSAASPLAITKSEELVPVTLKDVWQMALDNHESIMIASEELLRSKGDVSRAYSFLLPSLSLDGTYTKYSDELTGTSGQLLQPESNSRINIRLSQYLYNGGKGFNAIRQAKKKAEASGLSVDDIRSGVLLESSVAYFNLVEAGKTLEISKASLARAKEQLRVSKARFGVGVATRADVLRAEAEGAAKVAEVVRAKATLRNAEHLLARITKASLPIIINDEALFNGTGFQVDKTLGTLITEASVNRKDLIRLRLSEEIAKEGVGYVRGQFLPVVKIEGVHTIKDQTPETAFFLDETTYASITLSFPIFEGGLRRAELGQAKSKLRQAELESLSARRDMELEVRSTYNEMESGRSVIESFEKQQAFAKENYLMIFKQYKHGLADSTDLIDADTELVSADLNVIKARLDYELSVLKVKVSAGVFLTEVLAVLNQDNSVKLD